MEYLKNVTFYVQQMLQHTNIMCIFTLCNYERAELIQFKFKINFCI